MKAIIYTQYGPPEVLQLKEIENPIPKENEMLVKIFATSVTAAHCAMRKGKPLFGRLFLGLTKPKISIPGTDLSGVVQAVGKDVTQFKPGDKVMAATDVGGGCYAEYICLSEKDVVVKKPANMNHDEASAIIEGATTALSFLRDSGNIRQGQKTLINGASGSIGTAAVQLAKFFDTEVTGVCSSSNVDMVKSLGADHVIDYTREDFTKNGVIYDIIFDTVGKLSFKHSRASLNKKGVFLSPVLSLKILFQMMRTSVFGSKKVIFSATGLRKTDIKTKDMQFLKELIEAGKIKALIDRRYRLEEVADAHRYVEKGHKRGNIVIVLSDTDSSSNAG